MSAPKLIRIATVPMSFKHLLNGQIAYAGDNGFAVKMVSADGPEIADIIISENCDHHVINLTRSISPLNDLISTVRLIRFLIKEKPDIVHTHTPKAGIIGMLASFMAGVPVRLHTVCGLPHYMIEKVYIKSVVLKIVEKTTYKLTTELFCNSPNLLSILRDELLLKADKGSVIANGSTNGVDTEYFKKELISEQSKNDLRLGLEINSHDFNFIYVGRIVGDKGINELVTAFQIFSSERDNVNLLLVGPYEDDLDPIPDNIRKIIERNERIRDLGYQSDVRPYMAIAHCLVLPSYREGFPNVVMQACSMSLPCIVSDINGCNEIIEHEVNGLLITIKDSQTLHKAMVRIYENENLYNKLKSNAREIISSRYERQILLPLILRRYRELMKK